ncbi:unnamed protein product [Heligmosomoides polygyrus]|uniref:Activin_recp domain-containing protein n=1 Tax=Heligmosomoides polygyrus TaxID=6339 RepID=A0A183FGC3_HELPZ|nr:unnamed protein product [Heligmosomoides polygyrus]
MMGGNFAVNVCDYGMTYCFKSYSDDMSTITASCQTMNTDPGTLNACRIGCQRYPGVTVCCCYGDLCNAP